MHVGVEARECVRLSRQIAAASLSLTYLLILLPLLHAIDGLACSALCIRSAFVADTESESVPTQTHLLGRRSG